MSDGKVRPYWDFPTPDGINERRRDQPSVFKVTRADGTDVEVMAHDMDIHASGALILKRMLGTGPKITAWQVALVLPAGGWLNVQDITDWSYVSMPAPKGVITC